MIFSPEHLLLVKEGPQRRRNFIDGALCQIKPGYAKVLSKYNRSLIQRNTLLKDISKHPELWETMDIWNERLVLTGAQVIYERMKYVDSLSPRVTEIYSGISKNREIAQISYETLPGGSIEEISAAYREEIKKSEKIDLKLGFTSVGPHRDDLDILLNGISARSFGSQGQQRSAVLALKLAEADILEERIGEPPLILLDDVMSELDESRQDYLLNHLHKRQVFITCCSPETVNLMEKGRIFTVESGEVKQC